MPVLRARRPESAAVLGAAAQLFVRGVSVDWTGVFAGSGARRVDLPTYAFQRRRYWPVARPGGGDVRAAGLAAAGHPLLAVAVELAGEGGAVFTGRLSLAAFPWLADHVIHGTVLMPGTAFVEMAAWVGGVVGSPQVQELVLEAPLVLPAHGGVTVQLWVSKDGPAGSRTLSMHSRAEGENGSDDGWVRHVTGNLVADGSVAETALAGPWPPASAVPVPAEGLYARLAQEGYGYGPAFQGLAAAWRYANEVFAEVRLPPEQHADAARFVVHPALLDAALHAVGFMTGDGRPDGAVGGGLVPFSWAGVRVTGPGVRALRIRLRPAGGGAIEILAVDEGGRVVVSADRLVLRPVSAEALRAGAGHRDSLFGVEWVPLTRTGTGGSRWALLGRDQGDQSALAGLAADAGVTRYAGLAELARAAAEGQPVPPVVAAWLPGLATASRTAQVRTVLHAALGLLQEWLDGAEFTRSVLVVVTAGAVAAEPAEDLRDPAGAAVWGMVRSAQSEHPGRLVLADLDGLRASWQALAEVAGSGEPELAIRRGQVLGRRLMRMPSRAQKAPVRLNRPGTVLVTGAP
ncbi:MAG TPA: polyketide synthase dehydratase domain-containing protein, partial [Streptosporangiaceae bacterium]|nr:polyketide synthase dehydratase domain-containing protein [Streptosporangiaceae bacterium]